MNEYDDPIIAVQARNLTKAIFHHESGGDFGAVGDNGTSHGAGQWQQATWKAQAADVLGDANSEMTPDNQSVVAQGTIRKLIKQGKNAAQIAAIWNSGSDDGWETKVGVNRINGKDIEYNVPRYVKSVTDTYQQYKAQGSGTPAPVTDTPVETPVEPQVDTYGAIAPAAPTDNVLQAGGKSLINVPSSLLNLGKSLFSAITHPIHTIKGIGNAFAGGIEEGYHALTGTPHSDNTQTETFDALKQSFIDRYGSLENAQRTATNDPVGFGADVFSILEGGAGLVKATTGLDAVNALDRGASAVAKPVVNAGEKAVDLAATGASKILGQSTGAGSEAIKTAYQAGKKGGSALDSFTESLRGNTTGEDLVEKAHSALDEVAQQRSDNYKEMLGSLKEDTSNIDITPIKEQLDKTLENFNITKGSDGKLNFDESTIANPGDQSKVQAIAKDVENWKDTTPKGIDTLKQRIANYYEPGSKIGAFSESLRSVTRKLINDTPGYTDAMKNYSEVSDQIKDIKQALSLGDKTATETTLNKLKGALKSNNEFRKQVLQELDEATGGKLTEAIAGHTTSSMTPKGLAKYADVAGLAGAVAHGVAILPVLGLALTTSPRIVAEFVRALGIGARGTKVVMEILNKIAKPAVIAGTAVKDTTSSEGQ